MWGSFGHIPVGGRSASLSQELTLLTDSQPHKGVAAVPCIFSGVLMHQVQAAALLSAAR